MYNVSIFILLCLLWNEIHIISSFSEIDLERYAGEDRFLWKYRFRTCIHYEYGLCSHIYKNNTYVAMTKKALVKAEKTIMLLFSIAELMQDNSFKIAKDKFSYYLEYSNKKCNARHERVQHLLDTFLKIYNSKNLVQCLSDLKEFICIAFVPPCKYNMTENTYKYTPMCRQTCKQILSKSKTQCKMFYELLDAYALYESSCLNRFTHGNQFNCTLYPSAINENDTQCQQFTFNEKRKASSELHSKSRKKENILTYTIVTLLVITVIIVAICLVRHRRRLTRNISCKENSTPQPYNIVPLKDVDTRIN